MLTKLEWKKTSKFLKRRLNNYIKLIFNNQILMKELKQINNSV